MKNSVLLFGMLPTLLCGIWSACLAQELKQGKEIEAIEWKYSFSQEIEMDLDTNQKPWKYQNAGTLYSFLGNEQEVFQNFHADNAVRSPMTDHVLDSFMNLYTIKNARDYILKRSEQEEILIVNEAHHKPKHRVFTSSLLKGLYERGYRYLGLETLAKRGVMDSSLTERGYPVYSTGYYSMEPQFGNLIREALDQGFVVFGYEGEGNGKPREINQAKNIQAFMKDNKEGKYLIHCGYQHAQEGAIKGWEKAMAGRLLEYTGINPLTVNQTLYDNRFDTSYMSPLHQRLPIQEPSVLLDSNQWSYLGLPDTNGYDIIVFHEKNRRSHGRSNWLLGEEKSWKKISLESVTLEYPYLVLAIPMGNDVRDAVPVDLLEIQDDTQDCYLALKPGKYSILIQNSNQAMKYLLDTEK